jgi:oxygen-dependent protoporphyrinogen oxidase
MQICAFTRLYGNHQVRQGLLEFRTGETLEADALILATPAFVSGSLLSALDPELASALNKIPYTSTATVSLGYRKSVLPRELDGYGYVIPRREGRKALACTWTSTKFPHRAPDGYVPLQSRAAPDRISLE